MDALAVGPRRQAAPPHHTRIDLPFDKQEVLRLAAQPRMFEVADIARGIKRPHGFLRHRRARSVFVDHHVSIVSQPTARPGEVLVEVAHHEVYRAAVSPTGKTPEAVSPCEKRHTRMMVIVKRTQTLMSRHPQSEALRHRLNGQCAKLFNLHSVEHSYLLLVPRPATFPVRYSCVLEYSPVWAE